MLYGSGRFRISEVGFRKDKSSAPAFFLSAIRYPQSEIQMFLSAIQNPQSEIAGSSTWQAVFLSFAVVLILFEMVRGWRLGIMRQLMRVAAVAAAYAGAYFGGDLLVPLLRSPLKMPDIVISVLAGAILAMTIYGIIATLGTILFKRTAQQSSGVIRLVYGSGGALIGICFGAFFIWLLLVGIRLAGSIADAQVQAQSTLPHQVSPEPNLDADSVMRLLARLKNSVELGTVGDVVKRTDAMPTGELQTLREIGTVLANPETVRKFLDSPGARELSEHPRIVALRNDPEITEMIAQGRFFELLRDPRIVDAMNDPTLAAQVKSLNLRKALDHAATKN
jgi:hypothetical protein